MIQARPSLEELVLSADPGPSLIGARIVSADEDSAEIEIDGRRLPARFAVSCLIRPIAEDRVLVVRDRDEVFVLSVLERTGPNYATLALPGRGNLALAGETLSLTARQRLALKGDSLDLQAKTLAFVADKTIWLSKALTAIVERWRVSAKTHETSADSLTEKAVNRMAIIDQSDCLRTETLMVKTTGVASETAHSKVIAVTEDLRMDGKRITMG